MAGDSTSGDQDADARASELLARAVAEAAGLAERLRAAETRIAELERPRPSALRAVAGRVRRRLTRHRR